jgi:hypothetical protein
MTNVAVQYLNCSASALHASLLDYVETLLPSDRPYITTSSFKFDHAPQAPPTEQQPTCVATHSLFLGSAAPDPNPICTDAVTSLAQVGYKPLPNYINSLLPGFHEAPPISTDELAFASVYRSFMKLFPDTTFPQKQTTSEELPEGATSRVELGGGSGFGYQLYCVENDGDDDASNTNSTSTKSTSTSSPTTSTLRLLLTSGGGSGGGLEGSLVDSGSRSVGGGGGGGIQYYPADGALPVTFGGGGGCGIFNGKHDVIEGIYCGESLDANASSTSTTSVLPSDVVRACLDDGNSLLLSGGGGGGGGAAECCDFSIGYGFSFTNTIAPSATSTNDNDNDDNDNYDEQRRHLLSSAQANQYKYDTTGYALHNASLTCADGYKDWCCVCSTAKMALEERSAGSSGVNWLEHTNCCGGNDEKKKKTEEGGSSESQPEAIDWSKHHLFRGGNVDPANVREGRCDLFSLDGECPVDNVAGLAMTNCDPEWLVAPPISVPALSAAQLASSGFPEAPATTTHSSASVFGPISIAVFSGLLLLTATYATYVKAVVEGKRQQARQGTPPSMVRLFGSGFMGELYGSEDRQRGDEEHHVPPTEETSLLLHTYSYTQSPKPADMFAASSTL